MNSILHGDSLEVLKTIEPDSVDLLCTDPPYGYSFMGKVWDKALPDIGIFRECLRVLKPGAFAFVMSAPRSDVCSRMAILLEDAGFIISFTPIYWTYASGFPKAMNIGKMVDKRKGVEREETGEVDARNINVSKDKLTMTATLGMGIRKQTVGASPLEGSYGGFQPKPAVEVVIVAMKPLSEKTYVDQALKNGKGITWLDDCRVPTGGETLDAGGRGNHARGEGYGFEPLGDIEIDQSKGRFPANLLVEDDVLNDGVVRKSGLIKARVVDKPTHTGTSFASGARTTDREYGGDSGSYSRFFSLDAWAQTLPFLAVPKASKNEKNRGLEDRETVQVGDGRTIAADNAFQRGKTERSNSHPTVKPLKLMSYLITLGSRPGDVVLDPFMGSGTTCIAAKELGREFIGIEREQEYHAIAEARLLAVEPTLI